MERIRTRRSGAELESHLTAATPPGPWRRLWDRIEDLPSWLFLTWITALVVLRSGVSWSGTEELEAFARTFPHPGETFRSNAVLGPALGWALSADTLTKWILLHGTLTAGWFALTGVLLRRTLGNGRRWRVAMVWLTFASVITSMLRHLGSYDVFTLTGATLIALGGTPWLALLGGLVMGATNVEQGLLAVACGALVHWALSDPDGGSRTLGVTIRTFAPAVAGLVLARAAVLLWFARLDAAVQGRGDAFGQLLEDSLMNALSLGSLGAYSWLGAGWVIVIATLWRLRDGPTRLLAAAVGLIATPLAATVTTLDGSRVYGAVVSVALLLALVCFAQRADRPGGDWLLGSSAALMVVGVLVPAIDTTYRGGIRVPWRFLL
jgi:hypothetical protein